MQQVTVKRLLEFCKEQVKKGNGDKVIVLSDDNEGNGYHGMFYGFTEMSSDYIDEVSDSNYSDSLEEAEDNLIILG